MCSTQDALRISRAKQQAHYEIPASAAIGSVLWQCGPCLDQRPDGGCVGFAWTHAIAAEPHSLAGLDERTAEALYRLAQEHDDLVGDMYVGSTVTGGARAAQQLGLIDDYRSIWNLAGVIETLLYEGPVVAALPWRRSMSDPAVSGHLEVRGASQGKHAVLLCGLATDQKLPGKSQTSEYVLLRNSWGSGWGIAGNAWLAVDDLELLFEDGCECSVPMGPDNYVPMGPDNY